MAVVEQLAVVPVQAGPMELSVLIRPNVDFVVMRLKLPKTLIARMVVLVEVAVDLIYIMSRVNVLTAGEKMLMEDAVTLHFHRKDLIVRKQGRLTVTIAKDINLALRPAARIV